MYYLYFQYLPSQCIEEPGITFPMIIYSVCSLDFYSCVPRYDDLFSKNLNSLLWGNKYWKVVSENLDSKTWGLRGSRLGPVSGLGLIGSLETWVQMKTQKKVEKKYYFIPLWSTGDWWVLQLFQKNVISIVFCISWNTSPGADGWQQQETEVTY